MIIWIKLPNKAFSKDEGRILSGGHFLNAPLHSGRAEEKKAFRNGRILPVLTTAILCRDRHKCFARQTQVFCTTDTSVLRVRHKCFSRQTQVSDESMLNC